MSHHTCTTDTIASSEYFVGVLFSFWRCQPSNSIFLRTKLRSEIQTKYVRTLGALAKCIQRKTNLRTFNKPQNIFVGSKDLRDYFYLLATDKRTNRRTAASLKVSFHYVSGSLINLSWVMWYLSVTKQQSSIIIIITFISGAKPIAENRHNMKRTKIKHTNTHTNQSIEKNKIKTKIEGYLSV